MLTIDEVKAEVIRRRNEALKDAFKYIYGNQPWDPGTLIMFLGGILGDPADGRSACIHLYNEGALEIHRDGKPVDLETAGGYQQGDTVVCTDKWGDPEAFGLVFGAIEVQRENSLDGLLKDLVHKLGGTTADD